MKKNNGKIYTDAYSRQAENDANRSLFARLGASTIKYFNRAQPVLNPDGTTLPYIEPSTPYTLTTN